MSNSFCFNWMNFSLVVKLIKLSPGDIHRIAADFFANTYMSITHEYECANSLLFKQYVYFFS